MFVTENDMERSLKKPRRIGSRKLRPQKTAKFVEKESSGTKKQLVQKLHRFLFGTYG